MKIVKPLNCLFAKIFSPVKGNALFFVMMYVLSCLCAWITLPPFKGATVYENLYTEQFVDLYVICLLLMLCAPESTQMGTPLPLHYIIQCGISRHLLLRKVRLYA